MMISDYKKLMNEIGEDNFTNRLNELLRSADAFLNEAGYNTSIVCNERILYHVLLDFYSDIARLQEFHEIKNTKTDKVMAYLIFWIVRRKPIQIPVSCQEERDIFVNERFACYLLINECLLQDDQYKLNNDGLNKVDRYIELLLYYFKYRQINPQVIELVIESFKIGRLFPTRQ